MMAASNPGIHLPLHSIFPHPHRFAVKSSQVAWICAWKAVTAVVRGGVDPALFPGTVGGILVTRAAVAPLPAWYSARTQWWRYGSWRGMGTLHSSTTSPLKLLSERWPQLCLFGSAKIED